MLALTRKTDYALIALTRLAQDPGNCSSAREIATHYGVPLPLLMNILKLLAQRGLVRSVRGPRGGYSLALPADQITLKDMIVAVEGPVKLTLCAEVKATRASGSSKGGCQVMRVCPVRPSMHQVHKRLVEFLSTVTLADLVNNGNREEACCPPNALLEVAGDDSHEAADLPG